MELTRVKHESLLIQTDKGEKTQVVLQGKQRDGLEQFLAPVGLRLPEYSKTQDVPEQIAATGLALHTPSDIWYKKKHRSFVTHVLMFFHYQWEIANRAFLT